MKVLVSILGAISSLVSLSLESTSSENLVCVPSPPDVFTEAIRGPPGRRGPPGPPGPPGRSGFSSHWRRGGTASLERMKIIMDEKIAHAIFKYATKEIELDSNFSCADLANKVMHDGKCYWAIIPQDEVKFLAADRLCREKGATPANIYSQDHYDKVMTYLHALQEEFYYVYTGMEFKPETRELSNYDGSPALFSHWRARDPWTSVADPVSMSRVAINVLTDPEDSGNGMLTSAIIWPKKGVLCEI